MMMAPGFVSDVLALLLVLPPTRALVRPLLLRRWGRPGRVRVVRATYGGRMDSTPGSPFGRVTDVTDTTATETRGELEP